VRFAWIVCWKDLRQRFRDRTGLLVAVVVPLVLAGLVGLSLGSNRAGMSLRLALVDGDGGEDAAALRAHLARPWLEEVIVLSEAASVAEAETLLQDDEVDVALVLQPGFARPDARAGVLPGAEVLASGRNPFATRMTVALAERFLSERAAKRPASDGPALAGLVPISPTGRLRPVDFYAFSMAVLFLTFTVLTGVRSLQEEVDAGTLARLVASPASARALLAGKLLGLLLLGGLQMTVMIAATRLLFGTQWGHPLSVACLVATSVWMAIGLTSFFMSLASNAEQGQMIASISIFLLAIVGGQFMPAQGLPDVFDSLQRLTPNGQAARGFMDAAALARDGGLSALAEPLAVTFGVGTAGVLFAARRASRSLERALQ
jgi:ABC-2 type transport system permease protein